MGVALAVREGVPVLEPVGDPVPLPVAVPVREGVREGVAVPLGDAPGGRVPLPEGERVALPVGVCVSAPVPVLDEVTEGVGVALRVAEGV